MLLCRRDGRLRWKTRSKSLCIARKLVSKVYAWVLARSLERRARVCIAGVGLERTEPTSPAWEVEEDEHAVSERKHAVAMMEAAALVVRVMVMFGCPLFEIQNWGFVMGSR